MIETPQPTRRIPAYLLTILALLAVGIVTIGFLSYQHYMRHFRVSAEQQLSTLTELKVHELVNWRNERLDDGNTLFQNPTFTSLVRRVIEKPKDADARLLLQSWLSKYLDCCVDQIRLLDPLGATLCSVPDSLPPASAITRQQAPAVLRSGQITLQDFYRSDNDQRVHLGIMIPILDERNHNLPLGIIVLRIQPETYLYPLMQHWPTPSRTAETLLIRREGNEVVFLNELRFQKNTALTLRFTLDNQQMPAVKAVLGQEGIVEGVDYRGEPVIADLRAVPDSPWFIVAKMDRTEFFAPAQTGVRIMIGFFVILLIAAGLAVGFVWRNQSARFYRERSEIARTLQESEARYRELFDNISSGVAIYEVRDNGKDFVFKDFNKAGERIDRDIREVLIGKSIYEARPGIEEFGILEVFRRVWKTGIPEHFPVKKYHDERLSGWYENFVYRLPTGEIVAVFDNVTERRRADEALARLFQQNELILNSAAEGILGLDLQGNHTFVNPAAARMLGYEAGELLGKPSHSAWHHTKADGSPYPREECQTNATFRDGTVHRASTEVFWRKDGASFPVEYASTPIFEQGRLTGAVVTFTDITDRRRAEESLRESEEKYRGVFNNAIIGIYQSTPAGRYLAVNQAFAGILGYDTPEEMTASVSDIGKQNYARNEDRDRVGDKLMREGIIVNEEVEFLGRDGSRGWIVLNARTVKDDGGGIKYFEGTAVDITELKRAEEEKDRLEIQLQNVQKLESLGVLAGGIAHDFNNLLAAILGNAELAMMDLPPDSPVRESLVAVQQASIRASGLTSQMLAYSGKGKFVVTAIDVNQLVKDMSPLLQTPLSKQTTISYQFADSIPAIQADPSQIRQVLVNLVTNAAEAVGDQPGVVTISSGALHATRDYLAGTYLDENLPEGEYVYIEIRDSGCGMDGETKGRIFDPFFTTKFTGRGLGLAAVLGIVRGHKGAIRVESEPGRGSSFRVLFPASDQPVVNTRKERKASIAWRGSGTVLVVDDEAGIRVVCKLALERFGFKVIGAVDGEEGVELFQQHQGEIVLVILDLTMPRTSGEQAFARMNALNPAIPVILTSGYNEQEAVGHFVGQGLAGFLQKPFQVANLLEKVKTAMKL